jgi:hypothetical protein
MMERVTQTEEETIPVSGKPFPSWLSRMFWFGSGVTAAFAALALLCVYPPKIGETHFQQIKEGMTEGEVEAILGCPPGDYRPAIWSKPNWYVSTSGPIGFLPHQSGCSLQELDELRRQDIEDWLHQGKGWLSKDKKSVWSRPRVKSADWTGRNWGIRVAFGSDGRVIHHSLWEMEPPRPPPDLLRKLQWWLGW